MFLARWNEEFAGAFWCRRHEKRSLHFEKTVFFHGTTNRTIDLGAYTKIPLHALTTNVEIAILQANHFINVICTLVNRKRRWLCRVQNFNNTLAHLNLASRQCCVHCSFWTSTNNARHSDDVFTTDIDVIVDHALNDPGMVTQVNERQFLSVLATTPHPATD